VSGFVSSLLSVLMYARVASCFVYMFVEPAHVWEQCTSTIRPPWFQLVAFLHLSLPLFNDHVHEDQERRYRCHCYPFE